MFRILILLILIPISAFALTAEERLADPAQELRAHEIFKQIRCVVCSGESINDSKADIAKSLRIMVRDKIKEGDADNQIIKDITDSYGDSILMKPPVNEDTFILWAGPLILLVFGFAGIVLFFRQKHYGK